MIRHSIGALCVGVVLAFAAVLDGHALVDHAAANAPTRPSPQLIALKNIAFRPGVVRIAAGQSVTWRWEDSDIDTEHNVTSLGRARFASSTTKMTGTYTIRFSKAGIYKFECTIHPQAMHGEVIVR